MTVARNWDHSPKLPVNDGEVVSSSGGTVCWVVLRLMTFCAPGTKKWLVRATDLVDDERLADIIDEAAVALPVSAAR